LWRETGRRPMYSLTARTSQPMGKSQHPGVGRPLLFSPTKGRDARAGVSLSLREPGPLPLRERQRGSPSQGAAGHPLERQRGSRLQDRRKGLGFAQYHVVVVAGVLDGETQGPVFRSTSGTRSSPSQGATGHPLGRDREDLPTRRMCRCAKRMPVKGGAAHRGSLQLRTPPHRARPERGIGARTRRRTSVVFFFWSI